MKQYSMMETRWGRAAFAGFLFAMLLLARDSMITTALLGLNRSQFLMLGILVAFGLMFLAVNRKQWKALLTDRRMIAVAVSIGVVLLPMLIKRDWQMMYFSMLLCLLVAVFFTFFTDVDQVARYYLVMLCFLGLYSLVTTYILKYLVIGGKLTAPVFYNATGWEFYNFGLSYAMSHIYWFRNFGLFREPGVYQFFLLVGLYLNHYRANWRKPWVLWTVSGILLLTMFSTFAVGGFIETGLFYLFLYFDQKLYKTRWGKRLGISIAVIFPIVVIYIVIQCRKIGSEGTIFFIFSDLYLRLTTENESLVDRLNAIWVNAAFFFRHPLFGDTLASVLHGTANNTSSTLILYAVLGAVGGSLNAISWVALAWEKRRGLIGNLVLLLILFMSFNTQNLTADVFFWLFPYMALAERVLPHLGKERLV